MAVAKWLQFSMLFLLLQSDDTNFANKFHEIELSPKICNFFVVTTKPNSLVIRIRYHHIQSGFVFLVLARLGCITKILFQIAGEKCKRKYDVA